MELLIVLAVLVAALLVDADSRREAVPMPVRRPRR
jgi:hypothetical protein